MDLNKIQSEKENLELKILNMLEDFEEKTGLEIVSLGYEIDTAKDTGVKFTDLKIITN